ncbi:MAG: tyrosine--tRNA ligase [Chloroflexi bacterium]|nr:tyrosine--tRNA ligase [Chloroflexota bacterium]
MDGAPVADVTGPDQGPAGLLDELRWRGMFHAASGGLEGRLASGRTIAGYNGFDPSGPWLHIGNLVPIFGLIHLQRHGGRPVVVVGGGTGMIGDPSGRAAGERALLDRDTLAANVASQREQLGRFLHFGSGPTDAQMVNNLDWLGDLRIIDFLRDTGKHFTVPYMLAKDSVQLRLERGLSYTEFSYMLLQAVDFEHLHRVHGVEMQMGGADQWGNITAGLELIRRLSGASEGEPAAFALSYPLLLAPSGAKFGKSEGGDSIWLHADGTSPFAFYQYWLNTDDRDMGTYLRWFTTLSADEVAGLEAELAANPGARSAQRWLARDITARVHGSEAADAVVRDSAALFASEPIRDPALLERLFGSVGGFTLDASAASGGAASALAAAGLFSSNGEARRMIDNGGITVNGEPVRDPAAPLPAPIGGRWWEVRIGKRRREVGRLAPG